MEKSPAINVPDSNVIKLERQFFGESEGKADAFDFERIFKLLRRFKWVLLLFAIAGGLVSYFIASNEIPRFRTTVNVVVEPETSNRSEFLSDRFRYYVPPSFYDTQRVVVQSQIVLEKAARSLSPVMVQRLFDAPSGSWVDTYTRYLKNEASEWLDLVGVDFLAPSPISKPTNKPKTYPSKSVASKIKSGLQVGIGATQQLLFITMVSTDPLVAAVVANAVADAYISHLIENRVSKTERAGQWLAGKIEDSREKLTAAENALREYQFSEQLLDLSTSKSLSQSRLGSTNSTLLAAEQNYAQLAKKYGPKHPKLVDAKKKLDDARNFYGRESRSDLDSKEGRFELSKLERAVSSNRELYELFLGRFNEVELGIDTVSSNTEILERAPVPGVPFAPNIRKSASTGAFIGLLLGILLIVGRELMDRTFKNQVEVEERLQLPVLGILPLLTGGKFKKKLKSLIPERYYHENSRSNFSEVVNHVRTGIIYSNVDHPPKVILVTSPMPREGKTTCATNLSLAFSKLGKTLLVDADFRKPRIAKIAKVSNTHGLTGYVAGRNSLQECISQDSDSEDLYIMKSGEVPPNPLELLSSNRFKQTLELMKKKFEYIVIDSAPIIPVSDGVVLGKLADAIVMIIKAGSTTRHDSETSIKRLASANLSPIGVVLSQLDYKSSHYYYGKYEDYTKEYYG